MCAALLATGPDQDLTIRGSSVRFPISATIAASGQSWERVGSTIADTIASSASPDLTSNPSGIQNPIPPTGSSWIPCLRQACSRSMRSRISRDIHAGNGRPLISASSSGTSSQISSGSSGCGAPGPSGSTWRVAEEDRNEDQGEQVEDVDILGSGNDQEYAEDSHAKGDEEFFCKE